MDTAKRARTSFLSLFTVVLLVAVLYLGRALIMPLALAALFTFLLNPLVKRLMRWRIRRVAGVLTVTVLCFSTLALVGWLLGGELARLAEELPNHRHNINKRVESLKQIGEIKMVKRLRQLAGDVKKADASPSVADAVASPAPPPPPSNGMDLPKILNALAPPLASALGTAAVVILFVFFMLLRLDDLSQRFVRLVGLSRLTLTTKAMDEATERVGRYLLMQVTVNCIYGALLATGLAVIGLPYVVLWGALAALFRFIPYVGPWIIAVLPIGLSLAVFDGWAQPLAVIGLIVTLELVTNMILEPMLYGHSAGVSDFALLVAITFWTWLWGGIGLILATPLTVCIVVFCKYIPSLEWVDLIMGENSTRLPHLHYYQHHLANDEGATQSLIDNSLRKDGFEKTIENLIMPGVALTRFEEVTGRLTADEADEMYQNMRSAFMMVSETERSDSKEPDAATDKDESPPPPAQEIHVLARALQGEADALALEIFASLLPPNIHFEVSADSILTGELVKMLQESPPDAICISALPPRSHFAAGTLCRRLRSKLPDLKILVCRWSVPEHEADMKPLLAAGATWVAASVSEARTILEELAEKRQRAG
jgi:predicted PurR-regulated permease PerM